MRCLVTGAYGFIGREVVAALKREGVTAIGAGRDLHVARRVLPDIDWVASTRMWRSRLGRRALKVSTQW
jgi:uncharacterized protein YbjT (DUF2867 family)